MQQEFKQFKDDQRPAFTLADYKRMIVEKMRVGLWYYVMNKVNESQPGPQSADDGPKVRRVKVDAFCEKFVLTHDENGASFCYLYPDLYKSLLRG